jgi:hypothetical protein
MHYSIRGGPAMDVIDVLAPATPQRHSAGFARLLRYQPAARLGRDERAGAPGPGAARGALGTGQVSGHSEPKLVGERLRRIG